MKKIIWIYLNKLLNANYVLEKKNLIDNVIELIENFVSWLL